jgi:hypothetical protein
MLYSGRHSMALSRAYSEMFGPVPLEVVQAAGKAGRIQELMAAVDKAVRHTKKPVTDWTQFAQESLTSSTPMPLAT